MKCTGRLERRWRPHQLFNFEDERGGWIDGNRTSYWQALSTSYSTHQSLRPPRGQGQWKTTDGPPRDLLHSWLFGRRGQSGLLHSNPAGCGRETKRILGGPETLVQLRPISSMCPNRVVLVCLSSNNLVSLIVGDRSPGSHLLFGRMNTLTMHNHTHTRDPLYRAWMMTMMMLLTFR